MGGISSLADQNVWEELTDEQRAAIRRLVQDGLGPVVPSRDGSCPLCGYVEPEDDNFGGVPWQ